MDRASADLQHYYLELSPDPVRFDAVSQLTNVFFDDAKQQVSGLSIEHHRSVEKLM